MGMKDLFITLVLIFAFSTLADSQEGGEQAENESTISEGYEQIQKMKNEASGKNEPQTEEVDQETKKRIKEIEEKIYQMEYGSGSPLYNPAGKRDPFKPFIQAPREEEVVITEATPPLKKYSLNEYRITGIVWVSNEPKAVVVDPEGNTYFLGKGDEIGNRNGVITEVRESGLLVKEKRFFEDVFGNKKVEVKNSILAFVDEEG